MKIIGSKVLLMMVLFVVIFGLNTITSVRSQNRVKRSGLEITEQYIPIQTEIFTCGHFCLHDGRSREISSDFAKMNSSAYDGTLEFIFAKSAQASRISEIGLPVIYYNNKL